MDVDTIVAAILHDTVEDTPTTEEDLIREFGKPVAQIVNGVTQIKILQWKTSIKPQLLSHYYRNARRSRVLIVNGWPLAQYDYHRSGARKNNRQPHKKRWILCAVCSYAWA